MDGRTRGDYRTLLESQPTSVGTFPVGRAPFETRMDSWLPRKIKIIKALTALVGRLSLNVGWENSLERGLRLFYLILNFQKFNQIVQTLIRRRVLFASVPVSSLHDTLMIQRQELHDYLYFIGQ